MLIEDCPNAKFVFIGSNNSTYRFTPYQHCNFVVNLGFTEFTNNGIASLRIRPQRHQPCSLVYVKGECHFCPLNETSFLLLWLEQVQHPLGYVHASRTVPRLYEIVVRPNPPGAGAIGYINHSFNLSDLRQPTGIFGWKNDNGTTFYGYYSGDYFYFGSKQICITPGGEEADVKGNARIFNVITYVCMNSDYIIALTAYGFYVYNNQFEFQYEFEWPLPDIIFARIEPKHGLKLQIHTKTQYLQFDLDEDNTPKLAWR